MPYTLPLPSLRLDPVSRFQNVPQASGPCPRTNYKSGYASAHSVNSEIGKSLHPHGMSPTSSPQKPQPPISQFTHSQSSMRPSATPYSPTTDQDVPRLGSRPSNPSSTFASSSPPHRSPPLIGDRVTYAVPQHSLPHAPPPHMVHSSPPFGFHHHPGPPGREASMSHMAYAHPSMTSTLWQHAPVYSYQGASTEHTPLPHPTHGAGTTAPTSPVYLPYPVSPSHLLAPRQASTAPTGEVQHLASHPSPGTYSPLGYTTPPPFAYPPTSFVPAPSIYGSHYPPPHHTPSYGSPSEQENQGGWWYFLPGAATAVRSFEESGSQQFNLDHPLSVARHEGEQSGQTRTGLPSTINRSPFRSRFGDLSDPRTETRPSSLPALSLQASTKSPPPSESRRDWLQERRSYHPKMPAQRSEWVMWVGNVPPDATPDELRAFFNRPLQSPSQESLNPPQVYGGVSSVFLIARSNCAFVNFESEAQLEAAVARFHGKPIRPDNPPCPRLVCRVRKRTDDLNAGVGAQRGHGMHVKWINEQRKVARGEGADLVGLDKATAGLSLSSPLSTSNDDDQGGYSTPRSSRSGSPTSTDTDILSRYFPQRYFILKSLTQVIFVSCPTLSTLTC